MEADIQKVMGQGYDRAQAILILERYPTLIADIDKSEKGKRNGLYMLVGLGLVVVFGIGYSMTR